MMMNHGNKIVRRIVQDCYRAQRRSTTPSSITSMISNNSRYITTFHLPDYSGGLHKPPLTKIISTIGPTSEQEKPLTNVTGAGMNIMRLNFSHATHDEVELRIANLQKATSTLYNSEQVVGILLDTKGPEIRTGKLQNDTTGHSTIKLEHGHTITLHTSDAIRDKGSTETDLYIDYPYLSETVSVGSNVLLDDGACILKVIESTNKKYGPIKCIIQNTALLRSRAGVNLPLADTSQHLPALSDKDKEDILYGMSSDVDIDYIAASFVQNGQGVRDIRQYIIECADKLKKSKDYLLPLIISKVETASSLQHFDDILYESDGIMVARGDLGVEIPLQQVTNAQKEMVRACNAAGKPCIVATQMLESMTKNPRPTRAEVADVTNAVYDGADAVMTSGETAKGKYPTETINFMQNILISAEEYINRHNQDLNLLHPYHCNIPHTAHSVVAASAVTAANRIPNCQAIVVMMHGQSSLKRKLTTLVSAYRPVNVPIIPICSNSKSARQLMLYRGVRPLIIHEKHEEHDILLKAKELYQLQSGEPIVIVSSSGFDNIPSSTMNVTVVP